MIEIRVPAKVMLSGEYAVLHGGLAALAPVPRELVVREVGGATQYAERPSVRAALDEPVSFLADHERMAGKPHVELDDAAFFEDVDGNSAKLGIGLSAAESVGVIALRFARAGINWENHRQRVIDAATSAHNKAQGVEGSGADVAACAFGRPITFRKGRTAPEIKPIQTAGGWDVKMRLVFAGQPADTRAAVRDYLGWNARVGESLMVRKWMDRGERLARMWFASDWPSLAGAIDSYLESLAAVMKESKIVWRLPVHDEWDRRCREVGARAKPVGAGGGDVVLLVGEQLPETAPPFIDVA